MRQWTENQIRAIRTLDRDVCVSAGAGSGKTGVLVERFLEILRRSASGELTDAHRAGVSNILVITFTEKATREMKERIVHGLLAEGLRDQRRELETAYISTIHGFCSRLLKENPFEAGVDPKFTVLDAVEAQRLLRATVEDAVEQAQRDGIDDVMELACAAQNERLFGTEIGDPLIALAVSVDDVLARLRSAGHRKEHIADLLVTDGEPSPGRRLLATVANPIFARMVSERAILQSLASGLYGALEAKRRSILEELAKLQELNDEDSWSAYAEIAGRVKAIGKLATGVRAPRFDAASAEQTIYQSLQSLKSAASALTVLDSLDADREEQCELLSRSFLRLVHLVWEIYDDAKNSRGVLDNEDLQADAVHLLETSPSVRRRYQRMFRYLLIDEFQDTNPLQMRLVDQLHAGNNLFIVGDSQQSIYGFRHADPGIFQDLGASMRDVGSGQYVTLAENFRARPEILRFVNRAFDSIWSANGQPFIPLVPAAQYRPKQVPSVEMLVGNAADRDVYLNLEARAIASRISQIVRDLDFQTTAIRDGQDAKPFRYRDMALLLRVLTDVERYEQAFIQAGIPYFVVGGGRGYYVRFEVRDVLNILTVLDSPLDNVALTSTLRSPLVGLEADTLLDLTCFARAGGSTSRPPLYPIIPAYLEQAAIPDVERNRLAAFHEMAETMREEEDRIPVSHLVERILAATQYDAKLLLRPNGRRRLSNVRKLVQMANAETIHGVGDFIARLREIEKISEREGDAPTEEEHADVVKITTIHRAKGLEYPVVFIGGMSRGQFFGRENLFTCDPRETAIACRMEGYQSAPYRAIREAQFAAEREESMRLLYVAMTRAREHLVLCGGLGGRNIDQTWAGTLFPHFGVAGVPPHPMEMQYGDSDKLRVTPVQSLVGE